MPAGGSRHLATCRPTPVGHAGLWRRRGIFPSSLRRLSRLGRAFRDCHSLTADGPQLPSIPNSQFPIPKRRRSLSKVWHFITEPRFHVRRISPTPPPSALPSGQCEAISSDLRLLAKKCNGSHPPLSQRLRRAARKPLVQEFPYFRLNSNRLEGFSGISSPTQKGSPDHSTDGGSHPDFFGHTAPKAG